MDSMYSTAEAAARLLIQIFREEQPDWTDDKLPIDTLVAWLGLHVATFHIEDYAPGTYGFMDPDEDEDLIWLCRDLPETFRRFTLAHELGHALLHCHHGRRLQTLADRFANLYTISSELQAMPELSRTDPCHDVDVQEDMLHEQDQLQEMLGADQSYDPRSQRELAANIFAAELLMPHERVLTLYRDQNVLPQTLANTFGVSQAAILNKLAGLLKSTTVQPLPPAKQQSEQTASVIQPVRKPYDEFQQAAIEAPTPALIVAGPGSGKTSTLIGRTEYIIRVLNVPPQQILALTFSRKAAQEMEERLRQMLFDTNQGLPRVSTFHAFCADVLRRHGHLVGLRPHFMLIDEAEGYFLLRQLSNQMRLHHYQKLQLPTYYFPDLLKAISRAKDELVSPTSYAELAQRMLEQAHDEETQEKAEKALEIAHVYALYQRELQRRGDTDFGGLLSLTVQLFEEHPHILEAHQLLYQHILVDEFQDVNRASGVFLRMLTGKTQQVWVVGDANQAIYRFRGASSANISQFTADFPGAAVLSLNRNYRSRPDLVELAESFRYKQLELEEALDPSQVEQPKKNQPVRLTGPETYVTLARARDESCELAGIVQDIRRKHADGYAYRDMVVLCRTRSQAKKIAHTLAAEGLPIIERAGMLEQEHIKDVLSMLLLLTDTSGMGILRAARQTDHPLAGNDIEAFLLAARKQRISPRALLLAGEFPQTVSTQGQQALRRIAEIAQTLQRSPDIWSLLAQYLLIESTIVRDILVKETHQKNQLADYDTLLQLARHYDQQQQARQQPSVELAHEPGETHPPTLSIEEQAKGFLEYLSLLVLLRQDGSNRSGTEENTAEYEDIIRVMTVHASKGLEFPVVYMPGLVRNKFPFSMQANPVEAPTGMLTPESLGKAAHESGESCLFYVGVTRARDHLLLSYSERYGKKAYKRSDYLDGLLAGLSEERVIKLYWEPKTVGILPSLTQHEELEITANSQSIQPSEAFVQAMQPATLSASVVEGYQRCPRQYAYSHIYHFAGEPDGYRMFWQATQKTIEMLHKRLQEIPQSEQSPPPVPTQQEIQELYSQHWQALSGPTTPFASMYEEHGHKVVEGTRRQLLQPETEIRGTHTGIDVDIAGRSVHVTIDRVESSTQTSGPVRFVRARYGKRSSKPAIEMRDLFYTLAARQSNQEQSIEVQSYNMSTGERAPMKMTAKKEQSLYAEVEQSIKGLEQREYPARPEDARRCPTCPFFLLCPA